MKIHVKKVMRQFESEYGIEPPSLTSMAEVIGMNRVTLSRIVNKPASNITIKTLERILWYLYDHYKPKFPKKDPKAFFDALQRAVIEFEVTLEFKL